MTHATRNVTDTACGIGKENRNRGLCRRGSRCKREEPPASARRAPKGLGTRASERRPLLPSAFVTRRRPGA